MCGENDDTLDGVEEKGFHEPVYEELPEGESIGKIRDYLQEGFRKNGLMSEDEEILGVKEVLVPGNVRASFRLGENSIGTTCMVTIRSKSGKVRRKLVLRRQVSPPYGFETEYAEDVLRKFEAEGGRVPPVFVESPYVAWMPYYPGAESSWWKLFERELSDEEIRNIGFLTGVFLGKLAKKGVALRKIDFLVKNSPGKQISPTDIMHTDFDGEGRDFVRTSPEKAHEANLVKAREYDEILAMKELMQKKPVLGQIVRGYRFERKLSELETDHPEVFREFDSLVKKRSYTVSGFNKEQNVLSEIKKRPRVL